MGEEENRNELTDEAFEEINNFHCVSNLKFPAWWVPTNCEPEMIAECDTLKKLLNNNMYQNEVNALARMGLELTDNGDTLDVIETVILAVGPSGLYLRAKTTKKYTILDEGTYNVEIPLSFGRVAEISSDLRNIVLNGISYAMNNYH